LVFRTQKIPLLFAIFLCLSAASPVEAWGSSVHHDSAIIIAKAFEESPSIPAEVREYIDTDTIYATSLAPDEWRDVTGVWGTWQYNMAENAFYEFRRIRDAWAAGDFDNAVARIGIVLHYIGDALEMAHSGGPAGDGIIDGVRDWYREFIEPLGSDKPLWEEEESGKGEYSHQVRQQIEAYSDSDSAWYPKKPENYGTVNGATDDGSLEWFLNRYFYDAEDVDNPNNDAPSVGDCDTVLEWHIAQTSPYVDWSPDDRVDNRWLYWVSTRDPAISKMDFDNNIRLTYNGVYRALRDGEYLRQGGVGTPPVDWSYWPWPTREMWLSLEDSLYEEGMDTARWYRGIAVALAPEAEESQSTVPPPEGYWPLLILGVFLTTAFLWLKWRRREGNVE
jgi:hypothetical protein